ncbi:LytTR family DNA-binding domain-containing protein [Paenibacillus melissococcoides]|uniref:LytTR family DNA-binding domain-containing protein n=1 Tax=Paenibacillus melissococcoides TaxID=2912268 RepID=A0ABM9FY27_9BACL|nr:MULTISPECIES: LytTR family DNA-binding domain-containing protein [Paenibacillus]MEB9898023.1 LytTR family DNA-binding domain-containing protein [Bacillus cereus]CAH8244134.1 LytTR family DNA-binding domain-containing protein [Paenibacillus melissococcoides]CAH8703800.1 LytTR family DNA-binding domain-containing protein [Paenibacillus melissococcoides]CAH8706356.1 LytTR family DNA-binding domain-containing protein [Paenibacillus melissococcoides]GIO82989.1 DNA-binding response regulator [Pae
MLKVAICDDSMKEHQQFQTFFAQLSEDTSNNFEIYYFFSGEALLQHYKQHGRYTFHVLMLDVEMEGMDGIETARTIRSLPDREVQIIYTTHYPQYMIDSFDVQPFHYMIKPVAYEQFQVIMGRLCDYINAAIRQYVIVKTDAGEIVLRASDIIAIVKIDKRHVEVITIERRFTTVCTLADFTSKLNAFFYQIYRSIIINLEYVHKFTSDTVFMSNKESFPLGRSYKKGIHEAYIRYRVAQFNGRG